MKYPKYTFAQDLRKKITPAQKRRIKQLRNRRYTYKKISEITNIKVSTIRWILHHDKELARFRALYAYRKLLGCLPKKDREQIRRCWERKKRLCPSFIKWMNEYHSLYQKSHREYYNKRLKAWLKKHPGYWRRYQSKVKRASR